MSVGSDLKQARESKQIPLEVISQKTRIPVKYLEALEEDHYDLFPSHTYAKGFIRAYCKVVGLDAQKMTREFKAQVPEPPVKIEPMNAEVEMEKNSPFLGARPVLPAVIRPSDAGQAEALEEGEDLPELHEPIRHHTAPSRRRLKWRSFYTWVGQMVIALAFLGLLWLGWQKLSPVVSKLVGQFSKTASATASAPSAPQSSNPVPAVPATSAPMAPAPVASQDSSREVADKWQHLTLKALDKSWILVTLDDGKLSKELDLSQGDTRSFQAERSFKLRIGNAGGVDIQLNGKPLGVLGTTGQVVEITLPAGSDSQPKSDGGP